MSDIDRTIVSVILGRGVVTPCGEPVSVIKIVVTAADQLDPIVVLVIPTFIVPLRAIRAEHFVPRTLPSLAILDSIVLVERNRWDPVRSRLRTKTRVLLSNLLHLLRFELSLPSAPNIGLS